MRRASTMGESIRRLCASVVTAAVVSAIVVQKEGGLGLRGGAHFAAKTAAGIRTLRRATESEGGDHGEKGRVKRQD